METPLPQVLAQHGSFVRALALHLLRDPHLADDAAQETWLRYLERAPDGTGSLRAWLRRVVTNWAANRRRSERLRSGLEHVEPLRASSSPAEDAARVELLTRVVAAVVALDEPYRTTILERYFHGRAAQQIARESRTPLATVRSREQRALEKLRVSLDRDCGGRAAWAAGLARLARESGAPAPSAPLGWVPQLAGAALVVVVAGVAWRLLETPSDVEGAQDPARVAEALAPAADAPAVQAIADGGAREPVPVAERPSVGPASSGGQENATNGSLAEIHGRFLFPGGAPAAGIPVTMQGFGSGEELVLKYGLPENWVNPAGTTDADGRFALSFDPPRAYQFVLDVQTPGHAKASWRWGDIAPGEQIDLGEVELPLGATIEGRVVDPAGNPLVGQEWKVEARSVGLMDPHLHGREETFVHTPVDPITATFRAENVWPGPVQLELSSPMSDRMNPPRLTVAPGETLTTDVVYDGPDISRRILVSVRHGPYYMAPDPEPAHIRLLGAGPEPLLAKNSGRIPFDDLAPGFYTLEIDDPRYDRWIQSGIAPGTEVRAKLAGSSALRLTVLDEEEHALERYAVRVKFRNVHFQPDELEVHDGAEPLAGGLLDGMVPGDYTIEARLADGRSFVADVDGLLAGETREVTLRPASTSSVSGVVVDANWEPVRGVTVLLLAPAEENDSAASVVTRRNTTTSHPERYRHELDWQETDGDGAFRFSIAHPGSFVLMATADGGRRVSSPVFPVAEGETVEGGELRLLAGGSVHGRLLAPAGSSFDGLRVSVAPANADLGERLQGMNGGVEVAADGAFRSGPLRAGRAQVELVLRRPSSPNSFSTQTDALVIGTCEVPEGGAVEPSFDVRAAFPGSLAASVEVNREARGGLELRLVWADGSRSITVGTSADSGEFTPFSQFAGPYRLEVRDHTQGWTYRDPVPFVVVPAATERRLFSITVVPGSLLLVDAPSGQPLRRRLVQLACDPDSLSYGSLRLTTDDEGRLALTLAAGSYRLALDAPARGPWNDVRVARFDWTSAGPAVARVEF